MLLPNYASLTDQQFAQYLDDNSKVDYKDLNIDVMTCDVSLLPHLALIKGANIDNLTVNEARQYIKTFTKKNIGTRGAVEDAINVFFGNAQLIEWFEDENNLNIGEFNVEVSAEDDRDIYNAQTFDLAKKLINKSKNVRSKLKELRLSYLRTHNITLGAGVVCEASCKTEMLQGYSETVKGFQNIYTGVVCETSSYAKMEV